MKETLRRPTRLAATLLIPLWTASLWTGEAHAARVDWARGCLPFIPAAESHYRLPPGLLLAVAMTESGQEGAPYPWAINLAGHPVTAPNYERAAEMLRFPNGTPRRDVAIGCMQLHMQYHLASFVEPEWALHPRYNIWYGAAYLAQLMGRYGNWQAAVAHYNGSDPAAQRDYLCHVAAQLAARAPATGKALALTDGPCPRRPLPHRPWQMQRMAARRVGRIIVLGADR